MNTIRAIQEYIWQMLDSVPDMKVLVMDQDTTSIVSLVCPQSMALQKEVYLFERIDVQGREAMMHLKAIYFVRPTPANIQLLRDELASPLYSEYHLYFANLITGDTLEKLAQADEHEVVKTVQEHFADYYAINQDVFSLNLPPPMPSDPSSRQLYIEKITNGLGSLLLSFNMNPVIRFEKASPMCQSVAQELARRIGQEHGLFDTNRKRGGTAPLLLIIDRFSDPVTPLLCQWTYQAMVHELLTLFNNRVSLEHVPNVIPELREVVLSPETDEFYANNMYNNFGDLAINIKAEVDELQKFEKTRKDLKTLSDLKKFTETLGEQQKLKGVVSKHITLISELSRVCAERNLHAVSEVEQELACNSDHTEILKAVTALLKDSSILFEDKLRVALLYAVRYETYSSNNIRGIIDILTSIGASTADVALISTLLHYGGDAARTGDLFGNKNWMASFKSTIARGLQGAVNVYTQHKPVLREIIDKATKNKLLDTEYPILSGSKDRASDVIVFIVGGLTYEEALTAHEFNAAPDEIRVVLGGTSMLNSKQFIAELGRLRDARGSSSTSTSSSSSSSSRSRP